MWTWLIPLWEWLRSAVENWADWWRERFDRVTWRPVVLVSALAAVAGILGWLVGRLAFACCPTPHVGFLAFGLTFSAKTFANILSSLSPACRTGISHSLWQIDAVFALAYPLFLCALYLWVERFRRHPPEQPEEGAEPFRSSLPPLSWLSSLIVVLPFLAGLLDLIENGLLLWAASRLEESRDTVHGITSALVIAGSLGAALKWTALGVYALGFLRMTLRGPRGVVLWRLRFSVGAVLIGSYAILAVAQGQDILQRLVEGEHPYLRVMFAVFVLAVVGLVVWYSGRVLTVVRLSRDDERKDEEWMCYFERHLPRLLGVAVPALAGVAFARAASVWEWFLGFTIGPYIALIYLSGKSPLVFQRIGQRVLVPRRLRANTELCNRVGRALVALVLAELVLVVPTGPNATDRLALRLAAWLSVVAAWAVYLYVYHRHDSLSPVSPGAKSNPCLGSPLDTIPAESWRPVGLTALMSAAILVAFTTVPVSFARLLSPLVVVSLTVANAVFMGSVLAYLGRRTRLPLVMMLIGLAALFSLWNDNHGIRVPDWAPRPDTLNHPGALRAQFGKWVALRASQDLDSVPVVLVAAAGGGLRAAYWTAVSLAMLQDRDSTFARHVFAISGVSGGSLGAAVFTAAVPDLAARTKDPDCIAKPDTGARVATVSSPVRSRERPGPTTNCVRMFMGDDYLSPILAKTVAPDFVQWFLPVPIGLLDRARTLERSWEESYARWIGDTTLGAAYLSLYADSTRVLDTPLLLLNTTHVQTGRRYVTAPFVDDSAFLDARSVHRALGADIRLSTAVHNSARFTYVSPAGRIDRHDAATYGSLVDGGYFENSGLATLADVRREIQGYIDSTAAPAKVVVLYLCNDPLSCRRDRVADSSLTAERGIAGELLSPLLALLHTRDARGSLARAALGRAQGKRFFQLNVCDSIIRPGTSATATLVRDRVVNPPLGWQLSRLARDWMDASLARDVATGVAGAADSVGLVRGGDSVRTVGTVCREQNVATLDSIAGMLRQ